VSRSSSSSAVSSRGLAEAPAPVLPSAPASGLQVTPRGMPRLRMSPRGEGPTPGAPSADEMAQMRDTDARFLEQLRQEQARRFNPYLAKAASMDDVGRIAALIPKVDVAVLQKVLTGDVSPKQDTMLKNQVDMESRGRFQRGLAMSESLQGLHTKLLQAALPALQMSRGGADPRTPTRGADADWEAQLEEERAERRNRPVVGTEPHGMTISLTCPNIPKTPTRSPK